jgi:hypothetical protein
MLGDQIAELKGKITGQRVLDVEGPTMETSVSIYGSFRSQTTYHLYFQTCIPRNNSWEGKRSNDGW